MSNFGELSEEEAKVLREMRSKPQGEDLSPTNTSISPIQEDSSQQMARANTSFSDFIEIDNLPSGNLFYNESLSGQALKLDDCIVLNGIDETNNYDRFTEIFSRRIKGVHPSDILVCDEMYISLWLRNSAYPNKSFPGLPYTCNSCKLDIPLDMSEFYFNEMKITVPDLDVVWEKYKEHNGKMLVTLPESKEDVYVVPRKRGHRYRIKKYIKERLGNRQVDDLLNFKLKLAVVIDNSMDLGSTVEWMGELSLEDFTYLKSVVDKYSVVSALPIIKGQCPSCQETNPIPGYVFQGSIYLPTHKL